MNQKKRSNLNDFITQYNEVTQGCKTKNNSRLSARLVEQQSENKTITPDSAYRDSKIPIIRPNLRNLPNEKSISTKVDPD